MPSIAVLAPPRWRLLPILLLGALLALAGCAQDDTPVELQGRTMGTHYSVKLYGLPDTLSVEQLQAQIDARLEQVNDLMSTYRPDSELSRFNASDSGDWFPVSLELAALVALAERISIFSIGAFDVTVGPAVNLWGFGPGQPPEQLPSDAQLAEVRERIGFPRLEYRLDPPALRKEKPGVYVDLSGIAKGHGVDQVAAVLESAGVTDYLAEVGGELRASGTKPDATPWRIAIERPESGVREVHRIVTLHDAAMATSGDYRNFYERDGKLYSHTINPITARPVTHTLASVSVIAADCAQADALATALLVLGPEAGLALAEAHDIAAFFVVREGDGYSDRATSRFAALTAE
ncbi:thiamine biosynthesis lipoprotein ApbE [Marichromatium purpuratum 984]|uniref:FAD:protein FMN transferase n=1 Tax=Marichromatium purpuratum 984 TaxID=765910 RepID=W0E3D5_MARPU|nr:FAD:protein FMN transferase [Marichromatium purpuratum]AHF03611.1 thiamine biosynthesis lipoprotein ApbE [Marichromatium purpuratum 984]